MGGPLLTFDGLRNEVLVETGTFHGDTVQAALDSTAFRTIRSIEIDDELYRKAVARFVTHRRVHLYHGPSRLVLPLIIERNRSTTFFLDAHKTIVGADRPDNRDPVVGSFEDGVECPLLDELDIILKKTWRVPVTIVIDDARLFDEEQWAGVKYHELFDPRQWPRTEQIVKRLERAGLSVDSADDRIFARKT
jgi:hypothetical protein